MKYKLGYISTKENYEDLSSFINEESFVNVGYINPTDFGSKQELKLTVGY